jgi:hypothetical protein
VVVGTSDNEIVGPLRYEFTIDDGSTWTTFHIDTNSKPFLGYQWLDYPNIDAQIRVRMTDGNGVTGTSPDFRLESLPAATWVEINGNNFPLPKDADVLIEWMQNRDGGLIQLVQSQGVGGSPIVMDLPPNTRSYIWRTPPFDVPWMTLRLEIGGGIDTLIGPFAIGEPASVEGEIASAIHVTPNPATNYIQIHAEEARIDRVSIVDAAGRIHLSQKPKSRLDVRGLPNGSYRLIIEIPDEVITRPLVISR